MALQCGFNVRIIVSMELRRVLGTVSGVEEAIVMSDVLQVSSPLNLIKEKLRDCRVHQDYDDTFIQRQTRVTGGFHSLDRVVITEMRCFELSLSCTSYVYFIIHEHCYMLFIQHELVHLSNETKCFIAL